jgi:hypothetical protein
MNFDPKVIHAACVAAYEQEKANCSGFVRAVGAAIGVTLTGNADAIVTTIDSQWETINGGKAALDAARLGRFVLVGLHSTQHEKKPQHGHVAIVIGVDGPTARTWEGELYRGKFPPVWGGSLGMSACSPGTLSVGHVWNRTDRENVLYRAYTTV